MSVHITKYNTIFPNVFSVLDHMFYVLGNGYSCNGETFTCEELDITKYQPLSALEKTVLLDAIKTKDLARSKQKVESAKERLAKIKSIGGVDMIAFYESDLRSKIERLASEELTVNSQQMSSPTDRDFTLDSFRAELRSRKSNGGALSIYPLQYKPIVFQLTKKAPVWLLNLARDMHIAWCEVLTTNIPLKTNEVTVDTNGTDTLEQDKANLEFLREEIVRITKMLAEKNDD